jgi:hypothetical protein
MASEKSKPAILKHLRQERSRLEQNLEHLKPEDMLKPGVVEKASVKDTLAHLADWEAHMLVWVEAARRGEEVSTPDTGLTWKQLDVFNERIYAAHCDQPLDEVFEYFRSVHEQFMAMMEAMPEEEMLTPGYYPFTGKGAIYNWLAAYAAHDLWGKTKIRIWMKDQGLLG